MSNKLPVVSGEGLVRFLQDLGYRIIRQRGSHIRLSKDTAIGKHNITIPNHKEIAKGTLNDIINRIVLWNYIDKKTVLKRLRSMS